MNTTVECCSDLSIEGFKLVHYAEALYKEVYQPVYIRRPDNNDVFLGVRLLDMWKIKMWVEAINETIKRIEDENND